MNIYFSGLKPVLRERYVFTFTYLLGLEKLSLTIYFYTKFDLPRLVLNS